MAATVDAGALVVGGTAHVFTAPVGTPLPTTPTGTLNSQFLSVGYTTEDGIRFADEKTVSEIRALQSFYPIRRIVTGRASMAEFTMLEWDQKTVPLAFGGGAITEPTAGVFRYDPPDPEDLDERAMVIDITDGDDHHRFVIRKGMVTSNAESTFLRTDAAKLPLTFAALGVDGEKPWYFLTDDDAFGAIVAGS